MIVQAVIDEFKRPARTGGPLIVVAPALVGASRTEKMQHIFLTRSITFPSFQEVAGDRGKGNDDLEGEG